MSDSRRPPLQPLVAASQVKCLANDMTVIAAADVPLAAIQEALAPHHQWLPADGDPSKPVGELIDMDSTGPLRLGFGGWRDILLGCQFTNGRGELISAGAATMKNVAGYDLTKLMVGQHGAFGRLATITARAYRRGDGALTARFGGGPGKNVGQLNAQLTSPCRPQWALVDADGMTCGYIADQSTLDYLQRAIADFKPAEVVTHALEQEADLRRGLLRAAVEGAGNRFRICIPPNRLERVVESLKPEHWIADGAFGVIWGNSTRPAPIILQAAERESGIASVFDGQRIIQSRRPDEVNKLLTRIKQAFDPDGVLPPLTTGQS